jgi:hypothetical protein
MIGKISLDWKYRTPKPVKLKYLDFKAIYVVDSVESVNTDTEIYWT